MIYHVCFLQGLLWGLLHRPTNCSSRSATRVLWQDLIVATTYFVVFAFFRTTWSHVFPAWFDGWGCFSRWLRKIKFGRPDRLSLWWICADQSYGKIETIYTVCEVGADVGIHGQRPVFFIASRVVCPLLSKQPQQLGSASSKSAFNHRAWYHLKYLCESSWTVHRCPNAQRSCPLRQRENSAQTCL